jgi:hypothetical protein
MFKRQIPLLITFGVGVVLVISKFIPKLEGLGEDFSIYFDIIAVFAFILGGGNLVKIHGNKVYRKDSGWGYSIVCLGGFFLTLAFGMFKIGNPAGWTGNVVMEGGGFKGIYDFIFKPLSATMFALLAFYVASASYRAFRAKNAEATILLVAAFIILLGRTFIGKLLSFWSEPGVPGADIPALAEWIMNVPNLAGQRAVMIGIALGVVSTSLKLILGIERSYLGSDKE